VGSVEGAAASRCAESSRRMVACLLDGLTDVAIRKVSFYTRSIDLRRGDSVSSCIGGRGADGVRWQLACLGQVLRRSGGVVGQKGESIFLKTLNNLQL
jgi:hypothetical protein